MVVWGFSHVRVGHCQALIRKPWSYNGRGFFYEIYEKFNKKHLLYKSKNYYFRYWKGLELNMSKNAM